MSAIETAAATRLDGRFRGELITPEHERYDAARSVFNAMFNRRPALIARCTGVGDVIAALDFARSNSLVVAVRGGGHSVPGYATCDEGIVIDLSPMRGIWVDPAQRVVRAQAGLTWGEFDGETQVFGLATTGGRVTTTGIAGLTLSSGSGWLERKFGLTPDNLLSVDLVTAAGEFVRASEDENAELFWGLRGGGGNFGIATSFEYRLHPLGPLVYGGLLLHSRERASELVRFWRDLMLNAPDEVCGGLVFMTAPPEPFVPEDLRGQPAIGLMLLYAGPVEEGEAAFRELRAFGPPALDMVQPLPYTVLQTLIDPANPPGRQNYWKSEHLSDFSDRAVETLVEHAAAKPSPFTVIVLEPKLGAISRVPEDAMALGHRDAVCSYYGISMWEDPAEADENIRWTRALAEAMKPHTTPGIALNFMSDVDEQRVRETYGSEKYERLVALKRRYDPDNLFCLNQNIKPGPADPALN